MKKSLKEPPAEMCINPRIVVTRTSLEKVINAIETATPTAALRNLMGDGREPNNDGK